jgi:hypothetical protein
MRRPRLTLETRFGANLEPEKGINMINNLSSSIIGGNAAPGKPACGDAGFGAD